MDTTGIVVETNIWYSHVLIAERYILRMPQTYAVRYISQTVTKCTYVYAGILCCSLVCWTVC